MAGGGVSTERDLDFGEAGGSCGEIEKTRESDGWWKYGRDEGVL